MAIASVVIPAHNEARVIARCLGALLRDATSDEFEVVVVANGCVDGTASVAQAAAPGAVVLDLPVASKAAALNAGDEVASTFPRIYLDADVELSTRAARDLVAALRAGPALIARPPALVDATASSKAVRRYHGARRLLDMESGIVEVHGGGVYAMASQGRSRFVKFPEVVADDLYVNWLFEGCERAIVPTEPVRVYAPLNGTALTAQLRRVYQGNRQLRDMFPELAVATTSRRARRLAQQLGTPKQFVPAASYVWFTARGRLSSRHSRVRWERDESTRVEPRNVIAGVPFNYLTLERAVEAIIDLARIGRPSLVTTANVDHVVQLRNSIELRAAYAASSLTFADGMPLVWLSRMRRLPLPERVTGADLFEPLLRAARDKGYSVMILGGSKYSYDLARARAAREIPGLQLHGCAPPLGFEADPALDSEFLNHVIETSPDLLFLCLGTPKQELWWNRHRTELPCGVSIGAGASLDFYAGTQRRAPAWMQRHGLEWAWRAVTNRRLLKRYFGRDLRFAGIAVRDVVRPLPPLTSGLPDPSVTP